MNESRRNDREESLLDDRDVAKQPVASALDGERPREDDDETDSVGKDAGEVTPKSLTPFGNEEDKDNNNNNPFDGEISKDDDDDDDDDDFPISPLPHPTFKDPTPWHQILLFLFCSVVNLLAPLPLLLWWASRRRLRRGDVKRGEALRRWALTFAKGGFTVTLVALAVLMWLFIIRVFP